MSRKRETEAFCTGYDPSYPLIVVTSMFEGIVCLYYPPLLRKFSLHLIGSYTPETHIRVQAKTHITGG
jgi:hypothetical protein